MDGLSLGMILPFIIGLIVIGFVIMVVRLYKTIPSDKALVKYGWLKGGFQVVKGGGTVVVPIVQKARVMDLNPFTVEIDVVDAPDAEYIPATVKSRFTIAIGKDEQKLNTAAQNILSFSSQQIEDNAKDIIYGQMRGTIATMNVKTLNANREEFEKEVKKNISVELAKLGLEVVNVNITEISDSKGYIEALGKEASTRAIEEAKIKVAEEEKKGAIGTGEANKDKEIELKNLERDQEIKVKEAQRDKRIGIEAAEAQAVAQENESKVLIAQSNAQREAKEMVAESESKAEQEVAISKAQELEFMAKAKASIAKAKAEKEERRANEIVQAEIEKEKITLKADAALYDEQQKAKAEAAQILEKAKAEAEGIQLQYEAKAKGIQDLVQAAGGAQNAAMLQMVENIVPIVKAQADAVSNIKMDSVHIFDGASGDATTGFVKKFGEMLPPVMKILDQSGLNLGQLMGGVDATKSDEVVSDAESVKGVTARETMVAPDSEDAIIDSQEEE